MPGISSQVEQQQSGEKLAAKSRGFFARIKGLLIVARICRDLTRIVGSVLCEFVSQIRKEQRCLTYVTQTIHKQVKIKCGEEI